MDNYSMILREFDRRAESVRKQYRKMLHMEYYGSKEPGSAARYYSRRMSALQMELNERTKL